MKLIAVFSPPLEIQLNLAHWALKEKESGKFCSGTQKIGNIYF